MHREVRSDTEPTFIFAPHLKAGAGAAAEALADTLTAVRRPVAMGETTLLADDMGSNEAMTGAAATRAAEPKTLQEAGTAILLRPMVAIWHWDRMVRAMMRVSWPK